MEPAEGVEPTTYRLQGDCSAVELRRRPHHCMHGTVTSPAFRHRSRVVAGRHLESRLVLDALQGVVDRRSRSAEPFGHIDVRPPRHAVTHHVDLGCGERAQQAPADGEGLPLIDHSDVKPGADTLTPATTAAASRESRQAGAPSAGSAWIRQRRHALRPARPRVRPRRLRRSAPRPSPSAPWPARRSRR